MHRLLSKGPIPPCLQNFCRENPDCRNWDTFYENYPDSYKSLKAEIAESQGYLCAYCEDQLPREAPSQMRIEHFHPKEDISTEDNWAFDWFNMLVSCHGGSRKDTEQAVHLHCDSSKEQIVKPGTCEGYLLNPLTMPEQCLFELDRATGELSPNKAVCERVTVEDNHYASVEELVKKTIEILNLNCAALNTKRRKIFLEFENKRNSMRRNPRTNKSSIRTAIAKQWFEKPMSFYTTRRILLGKYAEDIISGQ